MTQLQPAKKDSKIRPRDRDAIIQSLRAGVVPRRGHQHFQVGRADELRAIVADLERVRDGGASSKFVIGEYGSGKTFFLLLVRTVALELNLVATSADLAPDRRLHSTEGLARALYSELAANIATRTKPEGSALPNVVERFVTGAIQEAQQSGREASAVIASRLAQLSELPNGYDFAEVVGAYWRGHDQGDDALKSNAIRWLRGEINTKTEARQLLGVRAIVDDESAYDFIKILARFVRLAGYDGLLVCLDEMVNLYKLANSKSRQGNYEQILRIVNDTLQGGVEGLGILFGGTPEFLMDDRRGLYSYEALRSRLAQNSFLRDGMRDLSGPVLSLPSLTPEEFFVLLRNLRHVFAGGEAQKYIVPDEALVGFMEHCNQSLGEAYFRTPRSTVRAFLDLLTILEQNAGLTWQELVPGVQLAPESNPDLEALLESAAESAGPNLPPEGADGLKGFRL